MASQERRILLPSPAIFIIALYGESMQGEDVGDDDTTGDPKGLAVGEDGGDDEGAVEKHNSPHPQPLDPSQGSELVFLKLALLCHLQ